MCYESVFSIKLRLLSTWTHERHIFDLPCVRLHKISIFIRQNELMIFSLTCYWHRLIVISLIMGHRHFNLSLFVLVFYPHLSHICKKNPWYRYDFLIVKMLLPFCWPEPKEMIDSTKKYAKLCRYDLMVKRYLLVKSKTDCNCNWTHHELEVQHVLMDE